MNASTVQFRGNRPTPDPSEEGNTASRARNLVPLPGGVRGGFSVMESEIPIGPNLTLIAKM